jgi:hypothetical protein
MNRFILRYGYVITAVILVVFAWVVYQRIAHGGWDQIVVLAIAAGVVWIIAAPAFVYFWPRITVNGYRRAILRHGLGGGPIPVNTLYAATTTSSPASSPGSLLATGTDDLVYIAGWLDLRQGPRLLHVPAMGDRYYSVQFTDPATSANFAYVGTRTTGADAGAYLVTPPGWSGTVPPGTGSVPSPNRQVLVVGRVFVADEQDLAAARELATQVQVSRFEQR